MHAESFFEQSLVYLAVAVLCVPLARAVGLGSVLGYLIGGVIIGPSMLGLVGAEDQDVLHFAEFGVVMMLFLIGLELDPRRLWNLRKPILGLGGTQVLLTTAVLIGAALLVGFGVRQAVAIGMTLALSSTAIVLQTLNEKGQLKTTGGSSAFSVLLFQDMAVIPMLSILPLLAVGAPPLAPVGEERWIDTIPPEWEAVVVLAAMTGIVLVGRFLARHLFRYIARSGLREVFTATTLLLVVGTAVLMETLGLSPALGTFLAGVVLADNEYRRELETNVEPFKALLLGLFFIAVGSSIDFDLIAELPLEIGGATAALIVIKLALLLFLGRAFGLSADQNRLFGFSLAQGSEFAFVLLSFATAAEVLPATVSNPLIAVVAISMAVSPVLLLAQERFFHRPRDVGDGGREADDIPGSHPVIVAGFGRFGNVVGRFLRANGVQATVLDVDSDRLEVLRQMGLDAYYGDASRPDVLDAAGAADARLLVVAVAGVDKSLEIVRTAQRRYPQLSIFARAQSRTHAYDLLDAGVEHVYRETLDSSLELSVDALRALGARGFRARRAAHRFRKREEQVLRELHEMRHDPKAYLGLARKRIEEMERVLQKDLEAARQPTADAWDLPGAMRRSREATASDESQPSAPRATQPSSLDGGRPAD